jgi:hypothetical protein
MPEYLTRQFHFAPSLEEIQKLCRNQFLQAKIPSVELPLFFSLARFCFQTSPPMSTGADQSLVDDDHVMEQAQMPMIVFKSDFREVGSRRNGAQSQPFPHLILSDIDTAFSKLNRPQGSLQLSAHSPSSSQPSDLMAIRLRGLILSLNHKSANIL